MEATAFDAAHVDIAFIHERFDEERKRLAAGPERWIAANVWPEGFHQLEAAADVGHNLWQYGSTATCKHA